MKLTDIIEAVRIPRGGRKPRDNWSPSHFSSVVCWSGGRDFFTVVDPWHSTNYDAEKTARYITTFDPTLAAALVRLYEAVIACDLNNEEADEVVETEAMESVWDAADAVTAIMRERGLE